MNSKLGQKLNITDKDIEKYHRFDLWWHLNRKINKLLDSDNPVDHAIAAFLLKFL